MIWTDADLDGAGSALVIRWVTDLPTICKVSTPTKLREDFINWLLTNKLSDFDTVYFLDIDTLSIADLIDQKNVTIIDHHLSHVEKKDTYKVARAIIQEYTSTCKLAYISLKGDRVLTDAQKSLILLVDDYDCYKLQLKNSKDLNKVFWSMQGDRVNKFSEEFKNGFAGFTQFQKNAISIYNKRLKENITNLNIFTGKLNEYSIASAFCNFAHNDIARYVLDKSGTDIVMLVNPSSGTVSFRKKDDNPVDLSLLAAKLCDGGGHPKASGGRITEKFLEFSKTLTPLK